MLCDCQSLFLVSGQVCRLPRSPPGPWKCRWSLVQTIDEYNQAMEANDPAGWVRYFTDNVRRHSLVSDQQGKKEFEDYVAWEFKNFQAKYVTKKILVSGRSAALVFVWDAMHRPSGAPPADREGGHLRIGFERKV